MVLHHMPIQRRVVAFVFPFLVLIMAGISTPRFIDAGLPWWPLFIFGLPAILAIVICVEYWNAAIGFDAEQVCFRSVGYQVVAPWVNVSERQSGGRSFLYIDQCVPQYSWWLGAMQNVLRIFMPGRSRYAHGLMAAIPLYSFVTAPDDAVMTDYRRFSRAA